MLDCIDSPRDGLNRVISAPKLMCAPKEFLGLLMKLPKRADREFVIERSVPWLFVHKRTDCIDALLAALENRGSHGDHLKRIAIRAV